MAQISMEMEAFSFEVPNINTLIINLDGGGAIQVSVESLSNLSEKINAALLAAVASTDDTEMPVTSASTKASTNDDSESSEEDLSSDDEDEESFEPLMSALDSLNMQSNDSFEEIETQQLY